MQPPTSGQGGALFVERVHLPFVIGAFVIALLGGFSLALALPLDALLRGVGLSWVEHAQVHGHLQAVGFAGFFIVGVSYRIVPRFCGHALALPRLVAPSFYLLGGGVLARFVGQPVADVEAFAVLMALSGWMELAGIACFAAIILGTAGPAVRRGDPSALLFTAGGLWFLVAAIHNAVWLTELWQNDRTILAGDRDEAILLLQFFGLHLMFIFAVGLRTFPVFFAATRRGPRPQRAAIALAQVGLAMAGTAAVIDVAVGPRPWALEAIGLVLLGAAFVWLTFFTGWWRSPIRLRPGSQPFALTLQLAMAWCTIANLLLIGAALNALANGRPVEFGTFDAVRHIIGLGVVTTAIVGMAQLILPEFAGERLRRPPAAWRGTGLAIALAVATALRAGARLFVDSLSGDAYYWMMAIAGSLALGVIVTLAYLFWRAARGFGDIIQLAQASMRDVTPPA
ncbi:MAG: NnrS family protein [Chloroflexi bacterium]|nr:NnrS family protein [Chloroflexota bacterium]